jgi:hypothetical protein
MKKRHAKKKIHMLKAIYSNDNITTILNKWFGGSYSKLGAYLDELEKGGYYVKHGDKLVLTMKAFFWLRKVGIRNTKNSKWQFTVLKSASWSSGEAKNTQIIPRNGAKSTI